ncbi:MAG: hypothetical protein ACYTER_09810 [Planctomycetota bacterium]
MKPVIVTATPGAMMEQYQRIIFVRIVIAGNEQSILYRIALRTREDPRFVIVNSYTRNSAKN